MIPIDPFTAVTGAVEVAWKIKKAMDQLTDNDQRLAELTSSLTTTIQELGYLIKAHQQDLASPEHLQDLAALQIDLLRVYESCRERLDNRKSGLSRLIASYSADDACRQIERLHQRVSERYHRFLLITNTRMYQRLTKVDEKVNVGFASLKENAKPRRRHDRSTKNRKAKEKPACDPTHNSIDHLSVSSMARSASRSTQSSRRSESSSDTNRYASSYSPPPSSIAGSSPSTPLASEHSRHAGHHYQSVAANSLAPRHKTTASRHSRIDDTSKFPLPASASRMPFMPPPLFAPFFVPSPSEGRLKHMLERTVYREYM